MPRQPIAPPSNRLFARVRSFDVECPHCSELILGRAYKMGPRQPRKKIKRSKVKHTDVWHPYHAVTSLLRCPYCTRQYFVGLILWPLGRGGARGNPRIIPEDMRPNAAQRLRLRQYATGFLAEETKKRGDAVNVYVAAECLCPMVDGGWDPKCPVHGWEACKAIQAEAEKASEEGADNDDDI